MHLMPVAVTEWIFVKCMTNLYIGKNWALVYQTLRVYVILILLTLKLLPLFFEAMIRTLEWTVLYFGLILHVAVY